MDLMVLDAKYDAIAVVDAFKSAIWTVRFNSTGDFELYLPATLKNVDIFKEDRYLWRRDSDRLMIISSITIETDADDVPMLTVTGESLESILKRRVIADYTTVKGNLQNAIRSILNAAIISPSVSARRIPNFIFKASTDPAITNLTVEETYFHGETVYDVVEALCMEQKIGFRVLPHGEGGFEFELYAGTDRSYDQSANPHVVFSPSFENLLGSRYIKTFDNYKNVCCSIGVWREDITVEGTDGEGNAVTQTTSVEHNVTTWATRDSKTPEGLARRETFLDNNSLDSSNGTTGSQSYWESVAQTKGKEDLQQYELTTAIDGELHGEWQWEYGKDYFLGDKVQVINEFKMEATSYISEIVFSADDTGERVIPTFTSTDDNADNITM